MSYTILVAEDDPHIREGLITTLESEQYHVHAAVDGLNALQHFEQNVYDLVMLDIMMPHVSGYEICREIRRRNSRVPIIMLTAKGEEIDKVLGLELGADDYITKPFGIRELLARVAAVLRRSHGDMPEQTEPLPDVFRFGAAEIDRKRFRSKRGQVSFKLSQRELKLLELFHARPDEVLSRNQLLNHAWGIDYLGTTRTLDQHIAQLRKKIEQNTRRPTVIQTVHGVGYRYCPGAKC